MRDVQKILQIIIGIEKFVIIKTTTKKMIIGVMLLNIIIPTLLNLLLLILLVPHIQRRTAGLLVKEYYL